MKDVINEIIENIKAGYFQNEASVSQGIIQRILQVLNWPIYNPRIVTPEYSLPGGRVDYALCHPPDKPRVFIEVKQIGKIEGAEKQLFEYAFHEGVPMVILTDGAEWHFFLPAEQGNYYDRRVYKLDLIERDSEEIIKTFDRYLNYKDISSGIAIDNARKDYKNVAKQREIKRTLPEAIVKLISEGDELLTDLICEKVESLCGYLPDVDIVQNFIQNNLILKTTIQDSTAITHPTKISKSTKPKSVKSKSITGFELKGKYYKTNSVREFCISALQEISKYTDNFFARYAALPKHGKKRRFIASSKFDLYPGRKDLAENSSVELSPGWWVGTNIGQQQAIKIVYLGCDIANLKIDKDFKVKF